MSVFIHNMVIIYFINTTPKIGFVLSRIMLLSPHPEDTSFRTVAMRMPPCPLLSNSATLLLRMPLRVPATVQTSYQHVIHAPQRLKFKHAKCMSER